MILFIIVVPLQDGFEKSSMELVTKSYSLTNIKITATCVCAYCTYCLKNMFKLSLWLGHWTSRSLSLGCWTGRSLWLRCWTCRPVEIIVLTPNATATVSWYSIILQNLLIPQKTPQLSYQHWRKPILNIFIRRKLKIYLLAVPLSTHKKACLRKCRFSL